MCCHKIKYCDFCLSILGIRWNVEWKNLWNWIGFAMKIWMKVWTNLFNSCTMYSIFTYFRVWTEYSDNNDYIYPLRLQRKIDDMSWSITVNATCNIVTCLKQYNEIWDSWIVDNQNDKYSISDTSFIDTTNLCVFFINFTPIIWLKS